MLDVSPPVVIDVSSGGGIGSLAELYEKNGTLVPPAEVSSAGGGEDGGSGVTPNDSSPRPELCR